jgi:hypothetical protein
MYLFLKNNFLKLRPPGRLPEPYGSLFYVLNYTTCGFICKEGNIIKMTNIFIC